jgi:3'(2'), 5'-bisphosphate nucleotidase
MNLAPIKAAVRRAVALCRTVQQHHLVANQKPGEPVTIADYGSQALIVEAIRQYFPADAVLAEESGTQFLEVVDAAQRAEIVGLLGESLGHPVTEGDVVSWLDYGKGVAARRTWVIDPIDGTKGFLALRHYAIAVGIVEDGQPVGGVMGCPGYPGYAGGALLWAWAGEVWIEPVEGGEAVRVQASTTTDPAHIRILESVDKSHGAFDRMAKVREYAGLLESPFDRIDSMEKYARIAAGDGELYLRLPRTGSGRPHAAWDHAAGVALVLAGGGQATDVDGSPLDFSKGRNLPNQGMIVSNGAIHPRVLAAVRQLLAAEEAELSARP